MVLELGTVVQNIAVVYNSNSVELMIRAGESANLNPMNRVFKKNLNASKSYSSEHPAQVEECLKV